MPAEALSSVIAACSGLARVGMGALLSAIGQKRERKYRRISERLAGFYGPLLALRLQVLAKSEIGSRINENAGAAWQELVGRAYTGSDESRMIDEVERIERERFPAFEKITRYGNRQLVEFTIPAYRKMIELITANMHLAEHGTIRHH